MIAALYVQEDGCYAGLAGVDPWPEVRDARKYAGPHPVAAHPPCQRWGNQTDSGQNRLPPSADRWRIRSRTYLGIAEAMAAQWGGARS